jgi:hypothetical protein
MLRVRIPIVALVLGVASLPSQTPSHASPLLEFPTYSDRYRVAQQGDAVHIAWTHDNLGGRYSGSSDGGRTWSVAPHVLPLLHVTDIACDGALVVVAGIEANSSTRWPSIMRSTDGGVSWNGPYSLVASSPVFHGPSPGPVCVHVEGSNVVCAWHDNDSVRARRSTTGGVSWGAPTSWYASMSFPSPIEITMIAVGTSIRLFWQGSVGSFQQASADGGITWLPTPLSRPDAGQVASDGSDLYSIDAGPLLARSHDGGVTWTSAAVPGVPTCRSVACEGPVVVVAGNSTAAGGVNVVNVSTDRGATWRPTPWLTPWSGGVSWPVPRVHCIGGDLYLHLDPGPMWLPSAIAHSGDLGASWRVVQSGLDRPAFGPRRNIHLLRVTPPPPQPYGDVVFVGTGYSTKGIGVPGTGSFVPELRLAGLPHLGATISVVVDDAVGGALGVLGFGFAPPLATPLGPATVWLQGPLVLAAIATSGTPGAPGAGSAALALSIPANPALVGANLTTQALLFDVGATADFSVTNAIEVWMR